MLAINVCLLSTAFDLIAVPLSETIYHPGPGTIGYCLASSATKKLARPHGYAHCSLVRLLIKQENLKNVKEIAQRVWKKHRENTSINEHKLILQSIDRGEVTTPRNHALYFPHIVVQQSSLLSSLRMELLDQLLSFHVHTTIEHAALGFHSSFPFDLHYADALNVFDDAKAVFTPQIALGALDEMEDTDCFLIRPTEVPLRGCRLVVSHMGGFLSAHEIL